MLAPPTLTAAPALWIADRPVRPTVAQCVDGAAEAAYATPVCA